MSLTLKQAKKIVLAAHPHAHIQQFHGTHLIDGVEGVPLSNSRAYENDLWDNHWIEAANKIVAGHDA